MAQEHFDMVVKNVKLLMSNKNMKAADLIRETGIDQSHMSNVLNEKKGSRFTLDQIIAIADVFNVSVDYLIGRSQLKESTAVPTNEEIYRFFSRLLESKVLKSVSMEMEDDAYVIYDGPDQWAYPYEYKKLKNKYKCFYFSNYEQLLSKEDYEKLDEMEQDNYSTDLNMSGNDCARNIELNEFLTYYYKLYDVKKNSGMDEDIYQTAIQDRLDKLKY
jgi:transcriptional regulator with XRE-family HTH domain